ncbi:unnamed protein product, partial [Meganyctiphanes norvegica]
MSIHSVKRSSSSRGWPTLLVPPTYEDFHDELDRPFLNVDNSRPIIQPMQPKIVERPRTSTLAPPKLKKAPSIMDMLGPPTTTNKPKAPRDPNLEKHNVMKRNMSVAKVLVSWDISLFSANANQLRTLLNYGDRSEYTYYIILTCLLLSLSLQLISGITLIVSEKFDLEDEDWSEYLNNAVVIQVFFIVIINVFISGFGVNVMSIKQFMDNKIRKEQTINFVNTTSIIARNHK